ncbi:hypothetical protein HN709_04415 [Candidatus Peregrinibacteria bacterium]|jgi:hypothetical protein|nr:hypothetical protein [Candidatus Peregrinibacteria bacterium]MBT7736908.1 hypothetical protein [Candidatus Peregrinibacteria bacterium]
MRKYFASSLLAMFLISFMSVGLVAFAETSAPKATVLPDTNFTTIDCQTVMDWVSRKLVDESLDVLVPSSGSLTDGTFAPGTVTTFVVPSSKKIIAKRESMMIDPLNKIASYTDILACGIKTGNIPLWMVPFYLRWILEFIIGLAGLASVAGLVVGGYMYMFGGLSSEKDKGKNAIKNAVIGLVLTLTAWAIVNVVLSLVTG